MRVNHIVIKGFIGTPRLTTPEGHVIPIDSSFSGNNLSGEFELSNYGEGEYEVRITLETTQLKRLLSIFKIEN